MTDSFGARLRQRREERQIDLAAIADETKIKLSLLDALERDDVSHWPSGIFRRAYIRTYAQFIGLDPDVVLREFLEVYPDPGDVFTAREAAPPENSSKDAPPPTRLRTMMASAIGSLPKFRRAGPIDDRASSASPLNQSTPSAAVGYVSAPHVAASPSSASPLSAPPEGITTQKEELPKAAAVPDADAFHDEVSAAVEPIANEEPDRPHETVAAADPADATASGDPDSAESRRDDRGADMVVCDTPDLNDSTLETLAYLSTEFGRVVDRDEVQRLLQGSASVLNATGLIVWIWDEVTEELSATLVSGYSDKVLAHLPRVRRDADNATAAAFRGERTCEVPGTLHTSAALVVPLLMPELCAGVLAVELQPGIQPTRSIRAAATVIAAALTQLLLRSRRLEERGPGDRDLPPVIKVRSSLRTVKLPR